MSQKILTCLQCREQEPAFDLQHIWFVEEVGLSEPVDGQDALLQLLFRGIVKERGLVGSLVGHLCSWLIGSFARLWFPTISMSSGITTKSAGMVGFIAWVMGDGDGEEACSGLKCPFYGWVHSGKIGLIELQLPLSIVA